MSVDLNKAPGFNIASPLQITRFIQQPSSFIFSSLLPYLLLSSLCWFSLETSAQPTITSVQLSKSSNELTTLSGAGFGSLEGEVLSWDHFEDDSPASSLDRAYPIAGHVWSMRGDAQANIDSQYALSGKQSVKIDWHPGKRGFFGWKGQGPYRKLYLSYWLRIDGSLPNGYHRHLQLLGQTRSPLLSLGTSGQCWQLAGSLVQSPPVDIHFTDCAKQINPKFQRWDLLVDLQHGMINISLDNVAATPIKALSVSTAGVSEVGLGYDADRTEPGSSWFDDVYIASTQARIEACNTPEYTQCTRRYLQYVAAENWSDNTIKFRLHNLRGLRGEPIYLYVIDARGQVSNGIAIARPVIKAN